MAIKKHKPTSAARRFVSTATFEEITTTKPEKSLLATKKKHAGRNSYGRITVRHQGGGKNIVLLTSNATKMVSLQKLQQ